MVYKEQSPVKWETGVTVWRQADQHDLCTSHDWTMSVRSLCGGQRRLCGDREWRNTLMFSGCGHHSGSCTSHLREGMGKFWSQEKICFCRRNKHVLGSWTGSSCMRGNEEQERVRAGVGLAEEEMRISAAEEPLAPVLNWKPPAALEEDRMGSPEEIPREWWSALSFWNMCSLEENPTFEQALNTAADLGRDCMCSA